MAAKGRRRLCRAAAFALIAGTTSLTGCSDPMGPDNPDHGVPLATPNQKLTSLSAWIIEATMWATPAIEDESDRGSLQSAIRALSGHLAASHVAESRKDVETIRSLVTSGNVGQRVSLGPIEVAMYQIEEALGN